jgi:hypothetical protein
VVLPATLGGRASLNLYICPVGPSGYGKDIANAAGRDAVDFQRAVSGGVEPVDDAIGVHPGSGEGLARVFAGRGDQPGFNRAYLVMHDVAVLEALADRKGQTLVAQLLAAWMGQPLGFANNSKDTTTAVDAHSYRLCLSVGVQPDNARFFLANEACGLPQRFLWMPTSDPGILSVGRRRRCPLPTGGRDRRPHRAVGRGRCRMGVGQRAIVMPRARHRQDRRRRPTRQATGQGTRCIVIHRCASGVTTKRR